MTNGCIVTKPLCLCKSKKIILRTKIIYERITSMQVPFAIFTFDSLRYFFQVQFNYIFSQIGLCNIMFRLYAKISTKPMKVSLLFSTATSIIGYRHFFSSFYQGKKKEKRREKRSTYLIKIVEVTVIRRKKKRKKFNNRNWFPEWTQYSK